MLGCIESKRIHAKICKYRRHFWRDIVELTSQNSEAAPSAAHGDNDSERDERSDDEEE